MTICLKSISISNFDILSELTNKFAELNMDMQPYLIII